MHEGWNRVTAAKGGVLGTTTPEPTHWAYSDRALADIAIVNEVLERHGIHNFDVAASVVSALCTEGRLSETSTIGQRTTADDRPIGPVADGSFDGDPSVN